jgi:lantibiotic modifying enzyme
MRFTGAIRNNDKKFILLKKTINMNLSKCTIALMVGLVSLTGLVRASERQTAGDPAVAMLKDFYVAYTTAWCNSKGNVLIKKLDSLQSKYCTTRYRKELKAEFKQVGLDHDELVNDAATDVEHLNTLRILKAPKKANQYIVSYLVFGKDVSNNPLNEKIVIDLLVVKENGSYKIDAVKKGTYTIIPNK